MGSGEWGMGNGELFTTMVTGGSLDSGDVRVHGPGKPLPVKLGLDFWRPPPYLFFALSELVTDFEF